MLDNHFYVSISVYQETFIEPQEPYFACIVFWVQSYVYFNISIYQEIFIETHLMVICGKELVSVVHCYLSNIMFDNHIFMLVFQSTKKH